MAELEALQGRATEAEASYRRAEAIVEGMLSRAPGRYAEASLLSAVAEIYAGHFRVAAAPGTRMRPIECLNAFADEARWICCFGDPPAVRWAVRIEDTNRRSPPCKSS